MLKAAFVDITRYLIIGGSTKCATTSLFKYFEYHPDVCPSFMKESRFFWTGAYQLPIDKDRESVSRYGSLFKNCMDSWLRMEATPDYMYSAETAARIRSELKSCKMAFLLREPVSRLISWYQYSIMSGFIEKTCTFDNYVNLQKNPEQTDMPQHLRSLEQGRYAHYLETYYQLFGKENILVIYYENLAANPLKTCCDIARFGEITDDYFKKYEFRVYNKTVAVKSAEANTLFRKFKRTVRPLIRTLPLVFQKNIKLAGHKVELFFHRFNGEFNMDEVAISPAMQNYLNDYYKEDRIKLDLLTGVPAPW